jgi:hypothetical protein
MSKKTKHEPHQQQKQQGSSSKVLAIIIILCFLGIMPVLLWLTIPEASPYASVTTSSPLVQVAANAAGLQICSNKGVTVVVPGATSGVLYQLSPSCRSSTAAGTVQILVIGFSSTQALNSAVTTGQQTYTSTPGITVEAFTSGYNVIIVQGAATNPAVGQLGNSLVDQGATQIPL